METFIIVILKFKIVLSPTLENFEFNQNDYHLNFNLLYGFRLIIIHNFQSFQGLKVIYYHQFN
jgi:hypothetical protein